MRWIEQPPIYLTKPTAVFYAGLAVMLGVSIWDLISPAPEVCEVPEHSMPSS